jgi:hypothetical protein
MTKNKCETKSDENRQDRQESVYPRTVDMKRIGVTKSSVNGGGSALFWAPGQPVAT